MKRGSALLIVLGLLSFLVVSAVAFSAYMRMSRLPSSYLLRTSSSRMLVKAALAEALNRIDLAIGDYPHPCRRRPGASDNPSGQPVSNSNQWRDRVFFESNQDEPGDKVSTLTLEGLAYVPAPLINDVRYWAPQSPTAAWRELDFDSGRYAFTAVDVSDYFDVNRVMAVPEGGGRTSAANARVTLAYLFEDQSHKNWRVQPDVWDSFMDNFLDVAPTAGTKVPLVSWADLNLALWAKQKELNADDGGVFSPWCRFIKTGMQFVEPKERFALSNMVFVTDSWYPREKAEANVLDLSNGANQPFAGLNICDKTAYKNRSVDDICNLHTTFLSETFRKQISASERVQLCDYLDVDSVPTSLALPTTERVPMLTGVELLNSSLEFKLKKTTPKPLEKNEDGVVVERYNITYYTLSLVGKLHPMVSAVYPFKYKRGSEDSDTFKAQIAATVTLVPKGSETALRRANAANPATLDWDNESRSEQVAFSGVDCKSVWALRSNQVQLNVNRSPMSDEDCLIGPIDPELRNFKFEMLSTLEPSALVKQSGLSEDVGNLKCTLRVVQKEVLDKATGTYTASAPEVTKGFLPAKAELDGVYKSSPNEITDGEQFVPAIQLGVRIVNSSGDNVDMMPACVADDVHNSRIMQDKYSPSLYVRPFLRFYDNDNSMVVSFSQSWFEKFTKAESTLYPAAYVADDPRFNHAPEDLVAVENLGGEMLQKYWLNHNTSNADGKDGDIYMATSDAGYLQSKFELAFLLNVTGLAGGGTVWGVFSGKGYDGVARTAFGQAPSYAAMWRTYSQYDVGDRAGDEIDGIFKGVSSGEGGAKVCPYTPDTAVMMGALANTPRDWWAASTNDGDTVKSDMLTDIDEGLKYTFSDHSESAQSRVTYGSMEGLAKTFIDSFRTATTVDGWRTIYDEFDWGDGALFDNLEKANPSVTFDSVDRKYLFGFWRECFAARQQLFLVFVRAEPMMMGGGAGGQIPPMLGARAVALVWRDPAATKENVPHRMRVLLYRQLD